MIEVETPHAQTRAVFFYCRENPATTLGCDRPTAETYCSIVGEQASPFATAEASTDARLREHVARRSVRACCGVPIFGEDAGCVGTLCRFDERPRLVPSGEIPLLEHAAGALSHYLRIVTATPGRESR